MNVPREVIVDLLPLYLADEASPASRALVEEYLRGDPELARRVAESRAGGSPAAGSLMPAPDVELTSLLRTRRRLALQRWLFALGLSLTACSLATEFTFGSGRLQRVRLLLFDYPQWLLPLLAAGVGCLIAYRMLRRGLRDRL